MPVRGREAVMSRIEALRKHAAAAEHACRRPALKAKAREVQDTLEEARAWLHGSPRPAPELVIHVAGMVAGASNRLYALVRSLD